MLTQLVVCVINSALSQQFSFLYLFVLRLTDSKITRLFQVSLSISPRVLQEALCSVVCNDFTSRTLLSEDLARLGELESMITLCGLAEEARAVGAGKVCTIGFFGASFKGDGS